MNDKGSSATTNTNANATADTGNGQRCGWMTPEEFVSVTAVSCKKNFVCRLVKGSGRIGLADFGQNRDQVVADVEGTSTPQTAVSLSPGPCPSPTPSVISISDDGDGESELEEGEIRESPSKPTKTKKSTTKKTFSKPNRNTNRSKTKTNANSNVRSNANPHPNPLPHSSSTLALELCNTPLSTPLAFSEHLSEIHGIKGSKLGKQKCLCAWEGCSNITETKGRNVRAVRGGTVDVESDDGDGDVVMEDIPPLPATASLQALASATTATAAALSAASAILSGSASGARLIRGPVPTNDPPLISPLDLLAATAATVRPIASLSLSNSPFIGPSPMELMIGSYKRHLESHARIFWVCPFWDCQTGAALGRWDKAAIERADDEEDPPAASVVQEDSTSVPAPFTPFAIPNIEEDNTSSVADTSTTGPAYEPLPDPQPRAKKAVEKHYFGIPVSMMVRETSAEIERKRIREVEKEIAREEKDQMRKEMKASGMMGVMRDGARWKNNRQRQDLETRTQPATVSTSAVASTSTLQPATPAPASGPTTLTFLSNPNPLKCIRGKPLKTYKRDDLFFAHIRNVHGREAYATMKAGYVNSSKKPQMTREFVYSYAVFM